MNQDEQDDLWCLHLFTIITLGGEWGVPRSGLIFRKESLDPPTLRLIGQLPYDPELPLSEEELDSFQEAELDLIREKFARVGITVSR